MSDLNRRAVLAGAACLPATAIPALATEADPIFAAIERHKVIHAEYERAEAALDRVSDGDPDYLRTATIHEQVMNRYCEETIGLAETQPTTLEGIAAALTYRADDHGDLNPYRYESLVRAACAIAGLPEPAAECFE